MTDPNMVFALVAKTLAAGADITGTTVDSDVVQFVAAQVSATADLIQENGACPTPGHVAVVLAQKAIGFTNLAQDKLVKCGGNLLALGLDAGVAIAEVPTGVGAVVAALEILADLYSTSVDCSPVLDQVIMSVQQAYNDWTVKVVQPFYQTYNAAIEASTPPFSFGQP